MRVEVYMIFISWCQSRRYGVGFSIREGLQKLVKGSQQISDRLCYVKSEVILKIRQY